MRLAGRGDEGVGTMFGRRLEASKGGCETASDRSKHGMLLVLRNCQLAGKMLVE